MRLRMRIEMSRGEATAMLLYHALAGCATKAVDYGPEKKEISIIYAGTSSAHKLHTARDSAASSDQRQ